MEISDDSKTTFKPFIVWAILILLIWMLSYPFISNYFTDTSEQGTFGDSFGAVNSLFSGLALAGIIYTILLQRKELQLQREELRQTRIELKRSADAQESSQEALNEQINTMQLTARLNALNTLVEHFDKQINEEITTFDIKSENGDNRIRDSYISEIESILKTLNSET